MILPEEALTKPRIGVYSGLINFAGAGDLLVSLPTWQDG